VIRGQRQQDENLRVSSTSDPRLERPDGLPVRCALGIIPYNRGVNLSIGIVGLPSLLRRWGDPERYSIRCCQPSQERSREIHTTSHEAEREISSSPSMR
jgi:hypothetical protein